METDKKAKDLKEKVNTETVSEGEQKSSPSQTDLLVEALKFLKDLREENKKLKEEKQVETKNETREKNNEELGSDPDKIETEKEWKEPNEEELAEFGKEWAKKLNE